jgi:hypothetical protein
VPAAHAATHFSFNFGIGAPVVAPAVVVPAVVPPAPAPAGYIWQPAYYDGYQWVPGAWVPGPALYTNGLGVGFTLRGRDRGHFRVADRDRGHERGDHDRGDHHDRR